jgi:hypothetical protein
MINEKTTNGIHFYKYASLYKVEGLQDYDIKTVYDFMQDGDYNTRMVTSDGDPMFFAMWDDDFESAIEQAEEEGNKKLVELLNVVLDFMTKHNLSFLMVN